MFSKPSEGEHPLFNPWLRIEVWDAPKTRIRGWNVDPKAGTPTPWLPFGLFPTPFHEPKFRDGWDKGAPETPPELSPLCLQGLPVSPVLTSNPWDSQCSPGCDHYVASSGHGDSTSHWAVLPVPPSTLPVSQQLFPLLLPCPPSIPSAPESLQHSQYPPASPVFPTPPSPTSSPSQRPLIPPVPPPSTSQFPVLPVLPSRPQPIPSPSFPAIPPQK